METIVLDQLVLEDTPGSRLWFPDREPGIEQVTVFSQKTIYGAGITVTLNVKTINPRNSNLLMNPSKKFKITIEEI